MSKGVKNINKQSDIIVSKYEKYIQKYDSYQKIFQELHTRYQTLADMINYYQPTKCNKRKNEMMIIENEISIIEKKRKI